MAPASAIWDGEANDFRWNNPLNWSGDVAPEVVSANLQSTRIEVTFLDDVGMDVSTVATVSNCILLASGGEANNTAAIPLHVELASYAHLVVTEVVAPEQLIGDPAQLTVTWTVQNQGTGVGQTSAWTDAIILSMDDELGNLDDQVLGRFQQSGGLGVHQSVTRSETILLPAVLSGRFHLFVHTDIDKGVFENGHETNNRTAFAPFDVMPIPYADLVVSDFDLPSMAFSRQEFTPAWTVTNQGIGVTNIGHWYDAVYLADDPAGTNIIAELGTFDHFGQLGVGISYERTARLTLPDGLNGTYYLVVVTAPERGPFEFIHGVNNAAVSAGIPILLTTPPDLAVTQIEAPLFAEEGTVIDVSWTVENRGPGDAVGSWTDKVILRSVGDSDAPIVELGTFTFVDSLLAGTSYTRHESIRLPDEISDLYHVVVISNYDARVYEHGQTDSNELDDDLTIAVSVKPRPDLQVFEVRAPESVDGGGTLSIEFEIINQGSVAADVPNWVDRVYLSLDNQITSDDILISELTNQSALASGDRYLSISDSVVVPKRYRGEVFILVATDVNGEVDEYPNDQNNLFAKPLFVNPLPLADLVVHEVVAPHQAIEGTEIEVRYTVTNLGSGDTDVSDWTDTIWLTKDKNRPHPGQGDILLAMFPHSGALPRNAGYDVTTRVTLPTGIDPGTYYIMPWTDVFTVVLEDTLASNINPDDPNEVDNNNYQARAIDILAPLPDLVTTSIIGPAQAIGGDSIRITWTVENQGPSAARDTGWVDRICLSQGPDPRAEGVKSMILAEVFHDEILEPGKSYTRSADITLSPSAIGQYLVVITDDMQDDPEIDRERHRVREVDDVVNNRLAISTIVTPIPADLVVTSVDISEQNFSGEPTTIRYTVTNSATTPSGPVHDTGAISSGCLPTLRLFARGPRSLVKR